MVALSGTSNKAIRAQIAETVSLIAELQFPERSPDIIDVHQQTNLHSRFYQQLVQLLNNGDTNINLGVLETAHYLPRVAFTRAP